MPLLGTLTVALGLDNSKLNKGAKDARSALGGVERSATNLGKRLATLAAAAAGPTAMFALVRSGLSAIDTTNKLATALGGTYDEIRALQIVASDSGIDGLEGSLNRLNRRLGAVEMNGGPAVQTLERLQLRAEDLGRMNAADRVAAIADAIKDSGMSAQEAARHLQQLGFDQANAVEMFMQGGDAIREARQEVEDFGLSISQVDAAQIENANDAMSRIGRTIESIRNAITIALAPILTEVAERFNDAARANNGFGDAAARAIEVGIRGFARVGDVIQGLRVVVKGVEAVFWGLNSVSASIIRSMMESFASFFDSVIGGVNSTINALNMLPRVEIANVDTFGQSRFMEGLRDSTAEAQQKAREVALELHELAMQPLPSDRVEEFLDAVRQRSLEAAQAVVDARAEMAGRDGGEREEEIDEVHREQLRNRLERIREANMEEEELLRHRHAQELELIEEARRAGYDLGVDYDELERATAERHQDELTAILAKGEQDRLEEIGRFARANRAIRESEWVKETSSLRGALQTMFGEYKGFGKAIGGLKRIEAVMSAYAWGSALGGPLGGAAAASAAGLAQLAQLNAMESASLGGGASSPTPSDGGVSPQQIVNNTRTEANISLNFAGQPAPGDVVQALRDALSDDIVLFDKDSAQGQVLT